jgi:Na+/proline symporter
MYNFHNGTQVLWTDSLQAVIMLVSMAVVVAMGNSNAGGMSVAWQRARDSNRINFLK